MLKLIGWSLDITHWLHNTTGQHTDKKCQDHHRQMLHNDQVKSSKESSTKAEVKPDGKNFIATNHLATKPIRWRATYNVRSRRINACVKGILHIINILLHYEYYVCVTPCQVHIKGF